MTDSLDVFLLTSKFGWGRGRDNITVRRDTIDREILAALPRNFQHSFRNLCLAVSLLRLGSHSQEAEPITDLAAGSYTEMRYLAPGPTQTGHRIAIETPTILWLLIMFAEANLATQTAALSWGLRCYPPDPNLSWEFRCHVLHRHDGL